ncbi:MAG: ATP-binding cassette domain-containing protein [Oscillospiraceae bacterium]|jgi:ABC-2 type transport system ATP-binding protein|nr:ATP-binding cassette domain-containing protein [Oscillospiraceae bacterium]
MSLIVSNLTKRFGPKTAVETLSFRMEEPGVYGLIGTNGAGKTTTIRMILGMLPADGGQASWNGQRIGRGGTRRSGAAPPQAVRYGYMPEERGIYMKTKVIEQLAYFGMLRGMGKSEALEAGRRWLARLKVTEYEDMLAENLSKGNQQKIQLISTLVHEPRLLFLDEPFSGLDPLNAQQFHELIQEMASEGKYIILSSHQMSTVEEYCREITLLHRGKALLQGNLREIKAGYGHTKLVLGAPGGAHDMAEAMGLRCAERRPGERVYALPEEDADRLCEKLLREMLAQGAMPEKFELSEPTLHEIFIKKVGLAEAEGSVAP